MKTFIGNIHDTRKLTDEQLNIAADKIKTLMHLDTIEIGKPNGEFYPVYTDDTNIIDFKLDSYDNDKVSLVKYRSYDDNMKRDNFGAILSYNEVKSKE